MPKTLRFLVLLCVAGCLPGATFYTAVDIGSLAGGATGPLAINSNGQVAGYSVDPLGAPRAFLYTGGAMQNLGALIGGLESTASGLNDLGEVAGSFKLGSGFRHAFLYSGGVATDLTPFHSGNSAAVSINNSGQIAGTIDTPGAIRAFLYSGGAINILPSFGGTETSPGGVNSVGQITGLSRYPNGDYRAFLYSAGVMTDLGTLGGPHSFGVSLNNAGRIAGYSTPLGVSSYHAFLYEGGVMTDLGTLGLSYSKANAINDSGVIVGESDSPAGLHAFVYENGVMRDLNHLVSVPATLASAYSINQSGQIVAFGTNGHGYLLTPAPPPGPILITSITGTEGPIEVNNSSAAISVTFSDPGVSHADTCTFAWGDGTTHVNGSSNGTCFGSLIYSTPGVYSVQITVTAPDGRSATGKFEYIVVYDPNGSFVTGSGTFLSPAGALAGTTASSRAIFGFVSKYVHGANAPSGNTEFRLQSGDMTFRSTSYQWLVISGGKAQFRGTGTVNGSGQYDFVLTATDGAAQGGGQDSIRLKIGSPDGVLYDNRRDGAGGETQALDSGSIVIHK